MRANGRGAGGGTARGRPERGRDRPVRARGVRGLTLVEIMVGLSILLLGVLGFSRAIIGSIQTHSRTREVAIVTETARRVIETLQATNFDDVFVLYNGSAGDDPGGAGTAPGCDVPVEGLQALPGDADGAVGEIVFPTPTRTSGVLRENIADAALGTPRDLNGDGIDANDHAGDYQLLPVVVRFAWRSASGTARAEFRTLLGDIR